MSSPALPSRLTLDQLPPLLGSLDELAGGDELDLRNVEHIDSAGVSLLLELTRRAKAGRQARLRFRGASSRVRELTAFLGVDALLDFEERQNHA